MRIYVIFSKKGGDVGIMGKTFNVSADCKPELHYMVDISGKLRQIKVMVDEGQYFTINRARQYGKTTTLNALEHTLANEYVVIHLDFQLLGNADFESEQAFVEAFSWELLGNTNHIPHKIQTQLKALAQARPEQGKLRNLFKVLSDWCDVSDKKIVLMIDEIDTATNNQVFLDFLAQLRGYYIRRTKLPAFHSVILSGVYDVKNVKKKTGSDDGNRSNSPWNIAADFNVTMSFSKIEIAGMLWDYENDNHTGMNVDEIAQILSDYTCGYPYLVSRICKLTDEKVAGTAQFPDKTAAWTIQGILESVRILLTEKNTLFESLMGKVQDMPDLGKTLYNILFGGQKLVYNPDDPMIDLATMFGFIRNENGTVTVANRIFETRLYNYFLTTSEAQNSPIFMAASDSRPQFIRNGRLDMDTVIHKYIELFDDLYGDQNQTFDEAEGRRRFLMYIRPIINGSGNYHIEEQTRNARRMDVVIDYLGERFIIELKIWRGNAYHIQGEQQLADYLEYLHLKKGYLLTYSFNKKKCVGVKEVRVGDKVLVEGVV